MRQVISRATRYIFLPGLLLLSPQLLFAQNSITALDVGRADSGETLIRVVLSQPLIGLPSGFTMDNSSRLVLDFADTTNGLGRAVHDFDAAGLLSANLVQAGDRTRLVLNLEQMYAHNAMIEDGHLLIALQDKTVDTIKLSDASGIAADAAPTQADAGAEAQMLRFDISGYTLEGASLLSKEEIDVVVKPFTGKGKDFSDVQRALEAVEAAYAKRGFTAVRVSLPEQELEKGAILFRVVESRFGKIAVKDNNFVSKANVLHALPSLRSGGVPKTSQIARELRLANENPARQLNVVLKAGETDGEVDASVAVTDSKPAAWGVTLDNSGSPETGRTRLGASYRHANLFDADHVGSLQFQMSPEHSDRVAVLGGGYRIPLYQRGDSLEFFGGYSNVNSVVGGLSNFQGGGLIFSVRYNHPLEKTGEFEPRVTFGLDWRNFKRIEQTNAPVTVLYNEIVVLPLSIAYSTQGKFAKSELNFNTSLAANLPGMSKGGSEDFASYDQVGLTPVDSRYKVIRVGASYSTLVGDGWQLRAALNGQWSPDALVQGEQLRLGGADAVRGFSEGSEGGDSGARLNLEGYTPDLGKDNVRARGLLFVDAGQVKTSAGDKTSISSAGLGLRASFGDRFTLRLDAGRISKAGNDPTQSKGDWRAHLGLSATF